MTLGTWNFYLWDPPRELIEIPFLGRPLVWYGVFFAFGFLVGYFVVVRLLRSWLQRQGYDSCQERATSLADRLSWMVVLGTIIGARLGHIFFYDWELFRDDPAVIFRVWEGGLASHGGAVGVLVAIFCFRMSVRRTFPMLTFTTIFDMIVIPSAFVGFCIRIGNFFNQEILGVPTMLPWAVVFGHPADGSLPIPRHPVQLYEAGFYLCVFIVLMRLTARYSTKIGSGLFSGLFFLLVFGFRIGIEVVKDHQHSLLSAGSILEMGQLLSIPFVVVGVLLCRRATKCTA